MDILLVATRYLLTRPISLISWLGVLVGVVAIVVVDSVMGGFLQQHETLLRGSTPDVVVSLPEELRGDEVRLQSLVAELRALPNVVSCGLRRSWPVLYRSTSVSGSRPFFRDPRASDASFVQLLGLDDGDSGERAELIALTEKETADSLLVPADAIRPLRAQDPLWFDASDPRFRDVLPQEFRDSAAPLPPILFGENLFLQMRLRRGQVLSLVSLGDKNADGIYPKKKAFFVVVGSYRSEDYVVNNTQAIVRRSDLLRFLGVDERRGGDRAEEVSIGVDLPQHDDSVREAVRAVGASYGLGAESVETWRDLKAELLGAIHNERSFMNFALLFLVLIAAFNLFVTLTMMVTEKVREIGVLIALGCSPSRIVKLFLACGSLVTVFGVFFGLVVGLYLAEHLDAIHAVIRRWTGFSLFQEDLFSTTIPTRIDGGRIALLVSITLVGTLLLTMWPSWRAGRLEAVDALRQED